MWIISREDSFDKEIVELFVMMYGRWRNFLESIKGKEWLWILFKVCKSHSISLSVEIFQERNKLFLTRAVVLELVHAVKFRSSIPDTNLQSVLQVHDLALVKVKEIMCCLCFVLYVCTVLSNECERVVFSYSHRPVIGYLKQTCHWLLYMYVSRARHWSLVFPRLPLRICFPALGTTSMFYRAWL